MNVFVRPPGELQLYQGHLWIIIPRPMIVTIVEDAATLVVYGMLPDARQAEPFVTQCASEKEFRLVFLTLGRVLALTTGGVFA